MRSPARSRSVPARNPRRLRTLEANFGLNPSFSKSATERSIAFGASGGLAGATMPTQSPGLSLAGFVGIAKCDQNLVVPQRKQLLPGLSETGLELFQKRTRVVHRSGAAKFFEFLGDLDDAFCAKI